MLPPRGVPDCQRHSIKKSLVPVIICWEKSTCVMLFRSSLYQYWESFGTSHVHVTRQGCYDGLGDWFNHRAVILIGIGVAIALIQASFWIDWHVDWDYVGALSVTTMRLWAGPTSERPRIPIAVKHWTLLFQIHVARRVKVLQLNGRF